jgi:hypothetical protein
MDTFAHLNLHAYIHVRIREPLIKF